MFFLSCNNINIRAIFLFLLHLSDQLFLLCVHLVDKKMYLKAYFWLSTSYFLLLNIQKCLLGCSTVVLYAFSHLAFSFFLSHIHRHSPWIMLSSQFRILPSRLAALAWQTDASSIYYDFPSVLCLLRASSSLCARPYWRFTRRAWWNRSSPFCTNPTNAMPAFPENDAGIHWQDLLHVMISQLHDRAMEKHLEPGTQDINKALLHFTLAKRLYARL